MIVPLSLKHASQVAQLHIIGIPTGFISSLGQGFVTELYSAIAESPEGFGVIEEEDGQVIGFVAFTTNLGHLYKSVCKKNGIRFFFILGFKLLSLKRLKKIFETLFYPNRVKAPDLPQAELLSIAVSESHRGKGIAAHLIQQGLLKCRDQEIEKVKVLVADFNKPANALYQKTGFELVTQIESHGIKSNIYVAKTTL